MAPADDARFIQNKQRLTPRYSEGMCRRALIVYLMYLELQGLQIVKAQRTVLCLPAL